VVFEVAARTEQSMDQFSSFLQTLSDKSSNENSLFPFLSILSYLLPKEICSLSEVSKRYSSHSSFDVIWKELCVKRWLSHRQHISDTLCLKRDGKNPCWKLTYKVWAHEMKIPHGKLMPIVQRVFGKSQKNHLNCWFYLRHANDCLLRQIQSQQSRDFPQSPPPSSSVGNLRLCLQNTSLTSIQFHLYTSFQIYLKGSDASSLPVHHAELSAKNGEMLEPVSESSQLVTLHYLDFVVITLQILCPVEIINEVDLLSSLDRVHIIGWRSQHFHETATSATTSDDPAEEEESGEIVTLDVFVDDEERIWDAYQTAPGGIILLKELSQMLGIR
jgi:hypothetical protein